MVSTFWRVMLVLIGVSALLIGSLTACKQRSTTPFGKVKVTPDIPKVEIQPVDSARVEELRIQFKETLEKVLSNPEATKKAIGLSKLGANARPKTYIVRLRPSAPFMLSGENPDTPLLAAGGVVKKRLELINAVTAEFPDAVDENHMIAIGKFLSDNLQVLSVEPDMKVKAIGIPNDPRFSELWGLSSSSTPRVDMGVVNAWNKTTGSSKVVVGVVDTGIDYNHRDLQSNIWNNPGEVGNDAQGRDKRTNKVDDDNNGYVDDYRGWDFVEGDNDPMDENNHGTHVAGTIGASGNNGLGVVGVNWTVKLAPLRFLDSTGSGYISDAITALQYATKMGFFATNHSWGGGDFSQAMFDAIKAANGLGQLFIAAAGNESQNNDSLAHYPSGYQLPNVIAVAAVNKSGAKASFSNYGKTKVHVGAPGGEILSTVIGNSYATYQGTSMAAPHVTGLAALVKAANPNLSGAEIKNTILNTVTTLAGLSNYTLTGGMINAEAAVGYVKDTSPPNAPTGLSVVWRGLSQAKISWTPAVDSNVGGVIRGYDIRYSAEPITTESAWLAATRPSNIRYENTASLIAATLSLPYGFRGHISIRAIDTDDNISSLQTTLAVSLLPVTQIATYSGDSLEGFPTTPWISETDSLRGNVFSDGKGRYPANANRHLKLPPIPIRSYDMLVVRFWHRLDIENNFDKGVLTAESNVADSEIELTTFSQKIGDWQYVEFDLTSQIGILQQNENATSLNIGFKLRSDPSVQADGWFVDDIEVIGTPSLLTVTGVPINPSTATSYSISLSQTADQSLVKIENYKASYQQVDIQDCGSASDIPSRSLTEPFVGMIPQLGKSIICISAPLKDYGVSIKRYYAWNRVSPNPPVAVLSGFPSAPSKKSFVTGAVSGNNVVSYSYFVGSNDEAACQSAPFDTWIAVSEPIAVNISKDQLTIVCVKGKGALDEVQEGYTKLSWLSDFTPPMAIISGEPPISSVKSPTTMTISGSDVTGYRYATGTTIDSCTNYGAVIPVSQKISLSTVADGDGERQLCVKGVDQAGNEQSSASVLTWIQDTVAQPIGFAGLPSANSNTKILSVTPLASESGQYRYIIKAGSTCDSRTLLAAPLKNVSQIITDSLPSADGMYTICAILTDSVGNVQKNPTSYSWLKDTVAPVATLSNLPSARTASMNISVNVAGAGVTSYRYTTAIGSQACDPSTYKTNLISMPIKETFLSLGPKKICVVGIDAAGNVQSTPVIHSWEIVTPPILTVGLLRVPLSPNSKQLLNIGVTSPSGQRIVSYRYGFSPGFPANCARITAWSPYRSLSAPITENLMLFQGFKTLCVMGKNVDGFEQMAPTMTTWLKINGAQVNPPSTLFGTIAVTSKTASAVNFRINRNFAGSTQNVTTKVCPLDISTGAINGDACQGNTARFNSGVKAIDMTQSGLSAGSYVIVVLPQSGRVDPLSFSL